MKKLLGSNLSIQSFLDTSNENDITLIREIVNEIAKNPQVINETIKTHMGKDSNDNMIDYLDLHAQEQYPEIHEFGEKFNRWQVIAIHDTSQEKPEAPTLKKSSLWCCCFGRSKKSDKQSLLKENEDVDSCKLL